MLRWNCLTLVALMVAGTSVGAVASKPHPIAHPTRVAIFDDPSFPYFGANPGVTGPDIQDWLHRAGISADLLSADALADPARFNASRYAVLIHMYGNTFPAEAGNNIRLFHREGGSLVVTGIAFCHPCVQTWAADWQQAIGDGDSGERLQSAAHTGKYGLRIVKKSAGWTGFLSSGWKLPARPDERFSLSGWFRASSDVKAGDGLLLRCWDRAGRFLGQEGPALPAHSTTWTHAEGAVTTQPGTASVDVVFALFHADASCDVDDLGLSRLGPGGRAGPNLLPDPGFEQAGGEWHDEGHIPWFGPEQIGTGGFHNAAGHGTLAYHAAGDLLHLGVMGWAARTQAWAATPSDEAQALDPATLGSQDRVTPVLSVHDSQGDWPLIAVIHHHSKELSGVTDVWAGGPYFANNDASSSLDQIEVIGRAVVYLLHERGLLADTASILRRAAHTYVASQPPCNLRSTAAPSDGRVFPALKRPASTVWVADVRALPLDEKLALCSLQGVVNGRQPRIYLLYDSASPGKQSVDERWLRWMRQRGDIQSSQHVTDPWQLLTQFRSEIRGAVITDPHVPATVDVGTTLCGLDDAVLMSPEVASKHPLPVLADLRGRWSTNADAYEWAFEHLWPRCNHRVLGLMYPGWVGPRDYLIAEHGFAFWISGAVDAQPPVGSPLQERLVACRLLASAPVNVGVLGAPWAGDNVGIQEAPGVTLLSQYGKFMVWSAQTHNLSVHAGTAPCGPMNRPLTVPAASHPGAAGKPADPSHDKVYFSFLVSDGDAPINWYSFFLTRYWDDPHRGTFPIAWSLGPTASDLMPDILDYYRRKAGPNDEFVCAVDGLGYCYTPWYADRYRDQASVLKHYFALTGLYMRRLGLRGLWTQSQEHFVLGRFARQISGLGFILADYGLFPGATAANVTSMVNGVPTFHAVTGFETEPSPAQEVGLLTGGIRQCTPSQRPAFLNAFVQCYPCSPTLLAEVLKQLGPDYVPVLPSELAKLYRELFHAD